MNDNDLIELNCVDSDTDFHGNCKPLLYAPRNFLQLFKRKTYMKLSPPYLWAVMVSRVRDNIVIRRNINDLLLSGSKINRGALCPMLQDKLFGHITHHPAQSTLEMN